ncbi:3-hydroxyacyl-CoA dehydrogenase NAD-binding domain-containing protein, partial [Streptomyces violascens]
MGDQTDVQHTAQSAQTVPDGSLVGIVGAGTMGIGVAQCFAEAGLPVVVVDNDPGALASGPDRLRAGIRTAALLRRGARQARAGAPAPGAESL